MLKGAGCHKAQLSAVELSKVLQGSAWGWKAYPAGAEWNAE